MDTTAGVPAEQRCAEPASGDAVGARPPAAAVKALLDAAGLPSCDLAEPDMENFFYAGSPGAPDGVVGLEFRGEFALLRSLAVAPARRSAGIGSMLVAHAESRARERGARAVFLLTTTAAEFFARRGYVAADRGEAPPAIRATRQFAELCPAGSAFMVKHL